MKSLFFCLLLGSNTHFCQPLLAQSDSLSAGDTISINRQRIFISVLRTYRYHLASSLRSNQLSPLLKSSDNEEVNRYYRRYRQQERLAFTLMGTGYAVMVSGLIISFKHPVASVPVMVGGLGLFFSAPAFRAERNMERAVQQYNAVLRTNSGDYYRPMFDLRSQSDRLTLADTVSIRGSFLYPKFIYREVRVDPAANLKTAFNYLNSGRVNSNMRYIRTARGVAGFVTSLAVNTLTFYTLYYAAQRSRGPYLFNRGIIYPALGTLGLGIVAIWHVNRQQVGTMREYNAKLKEKGE